MIQPGIGASYRIKSLTSELSVQIEVGGFGQLVIRVIHYQGAGNS